MKAALRAWWHGIVLRDAVLFTLPFVAVVVYVYAVSVARAARAREFDDWWSRPKGVYQFAGYQVRGWLHVLETQELAHRLDEELPDAGALRLDLWRRDWDLIDRDPQAAFDRELRGAIRDRGSFHPVKVRLHGDTSEHWLTEKPSFTVQTSEDAGYRGHRALAFSSEAVLPSYFAAKLAPDFGLLAPRTAISPVYLNGRFLGVYRFQETPDESLLRRAGELPGDILRGEVLESVPPGPFRNPYVWSRVASGGAPDAPVRATLCALVAELHDTSADAREALLARFDAEEIGRLLAFLLVVGDLVHVSDFHDQWWYDDPSDRRLHPLVQEVHVRRLAEPVVGLSSALKSLLREPAILQNALQRLRIELDDHDLVARIDRIALDAERAHADAFAFDRLRAGAISAVGSPEEVLHIVHENLDLLGSWMDDARVEFCASAAGADGSRVLDFVSRGMAGARLTAIEIAAPLPAGTRPVLIADRDRDGRAGAGDAEIPLRVVVERSGTRLTPETEVALLPAADPATLPLASAPLHYRLFLSTPGSTAPLHVELRNRITGAQVEPTPLAVETALPASASWHPWEAPEHAPETLAWSGVQTLAETLVLQPHQRLVIAPGTRVELGPDVSVIARGPVHALGTAEQPIEFVPARAGVPFGSVALLGAAASGSEFAHCRFTGGGGATAFGVELTGMVSVHRVAGVSFTSCDFRDNERSDDAIHVVRSDATLRDCVFAHAHGDGIDFDLSTGVIAGCRVEGSGDDAIDLMQSRPLIAGCTLIGSGAGGVSVRGESAPLIFASLIRDCARGIEVEERSEPRLVHDVIEHNGFGIHHLESPADGAGGFAKLARTVVRDNAAPNQSDARSRLTGIDDGDDLVVACLLAEHSLRAPATPPGLVSSWEPDAVARVVAAASFEEDFERLTDGWRPVGAVARLGKRDRDLVASVAEGGGMSTTLAWDCLATDVRWVALVELEPSDCAAELTVTGDAGPVSQRIAAPSDRGARFAALELPAGRYRELRLCAAAAGPRARIALHAYRLCALPR